MYRTLEKDLEINPEVGEIGGKRLIRTEDQLVQFLRQRCPLDIYGDELTVNY